MWGILNEIFSPKGMLMTSRNFVLPSLKMIETFEVAARLGSFKEAAGELGVTPGAVSHQVRGLEQLLEINLFVRQSRTVVLTSEGIALYEVASKSINEIRQSIQKILAVNETAQISIGSTTAVSSMWLTPKIAEFWRDFGHIQINQEVRDRPFRRPLSLDLTIEYAVSPPKEIAKVLFEDKLLPLCSPEFKRTNINTLKELSQSHLIHLDANETNWTSWPNWFAALGYDGELSVRHRVNNYAIALQLAQDGLGVVLGWKHLVNPLIDNGRLVPLTSFEIDAPGKFYLIPSRGKIKEQVRVFSSWILP